MTALVIYLFVLTKHLARSNLRKEGGEEGKREIGFIMLMFQGGQVEDTVKSWRQELKCGGSHCTGNQAIIPPGSPLFTYFL